MYFFFALTFGLFRVFEVDWAGVVAFAELETAWVLAWGIEDDGEEDRKVDEGETESEGSGPVESTARNMFDFCVFWISSWTSGALEIET